jgi:hypothetical protein
MGMLAGFRLNPDTCSRVLGAAAGGRRAIPILRSNGDGGTRQKMLGAKNFYFLLIVAAGTFGAMNVALADASMDRVLKELEPEERAHQACTIRGLDVIRKGTRLRAIDRVKTSTHQRATFKNNVVTATSAAVRANHHWYALKYKCTVTDDQMKAKSFDFKLGAEIPEEKWEDLGLWK